MARLRTELTQLRKMIPTQKEHRTVLLFVIFDGDVPEWASEAIRPYTAPEGVTVVTWRQDTDGELYAEIRGAWYHVTPDGCQRIEDPDLITFSVGPSDRERGEDLHGA